MPEGIVVRNIRRLTLAVIALGTAGMLLELLLIGHYEDANQQIPLALGAAALAIVAWVSVAPRLVAIRALQFVMLAFIGAGVIGITLHFNANAEFQRDIDPSISALELVRKVVAATAPPALSPGFMVQLGLLGLVYTYKHPALGEDAWAKGTKT
jgi:hypothetical protein